MGASSNQAPPTTNTRTSNNSGPLDEIAHFQSIPWCANHLSSLSSSTNKDNNLIVVPVFSRDPKPDFEDALFSTTLHTPDTIPAFICFYPGPEDRTAYLPQVQAFVSLGNLVAGYGGIAHGGVVASVFDDALSLIAPGSRWRGWKRREGGGEEEEEEEEGKGTGTVVAAVVTGYLTTRYLRQVKLPGTYLVTVWLARKEGRKVFVEGRMEDELGVQLASAEALFIETREKL